MKLAMKISTFLLTACTIFLFPLFAAADSASKAALPGSLMINIAEEESALSEEDTQKALEILHEAGDEGLTESDRERLLALGLTEDQIQMLQGLNEETGNQTESSDNWVEKELQWYDRPVILFTALGIVIAAVLILLIWISRRLLFSSGRQKKNRRV